MARLVMVIPYFTVCSAICYAMLTAPDVRPHLRPSAESLRRASICRQSSYKRQYLLQATLIKGKGLHVCPGQTLDQLTHTAVLAQQRQLHSQLTDNSAHRCHASKSW
jgi:hypothetical protein